MLSMKTAHDTNMWQRTWIEANVVDTILGQKVVEVKKNGLLIHDNLEGRGGTQ